MPVSKTPISDRDGWQTGQAAVRRAATHRTLSVIQHRRVLEQARAIRDKKTTLTVEPECFLIEDGNLLALGLIKNGDIIPGINSDSGAGVLFYACGPLFTVDRTPDVARTAYSQFTSIGVGTRKAAPAAPALLEAVADTLKFCVTASDLVAGACTSTATAAPVRVRCSVRFDYAREHGGNSHCGPTGVVLVDNVRHWKSSQTSFLTSGSVDATVYVDLEPGSHEIRIQTTVEPSLCTGNRVVVANQFIECAKIADIAQVEAAAALLQSDSRSDFKSSSSSSSSSD